MPPTRASSQLHCPSATASRLLATFALLSLATVLGQAQRIPEHLVHCYRSPAANSTGPGSAFQTPTNASSHHQLPHTLQLFVELLRKIEDANPTSLDMRLVAVNLLHRLRLDGIERAPGVRQTEHVTPFRANGIQQPKYQLLLQLISDSTARLRFDEWLTAAEVCQLHRMLSAAVEPWQRGDETRVCPLSRESAERVRWPWLKNAHWQDPVGEGTMIRGADRLSRCPLEGGVVRSGEYGSFAVGTVVASLAAGLQPQRVSIGEFLQATQEYENVIDGRGGGGEAADMMRRREVVAVEGERLVGGAETADNTYAAGLAGDLAEVCVYQGPYVGENVTVGLAAVWNNTLFPRLRYFPDASAGRWELTDAEILAGIDGLFLAQQIAGWQRKIRRLRLSQVIDMFYSRRGIPVVQIQLLPSAGGSARRSRSTYLTKRFSTRDDLSSACDRRNILAYIDWDTLRTETYNLAQILQYRRSSMQMPDAALRANCDAAVERFSVVAERLVRALPTCNQINEYAGRPIVDLTLVLDGSRSEYESLELVSYVVEAIDVSNSGSWISIINGQTGQYMVQRTRSVSEVFAQLENCTGSFPRGLSLGRSLHRLHLTLTNQTRRERQSAVIAATAHVVLLAAQKQRITEADFASAYSQIHGSMRQFPDLYYVFVTNAGDQIGELLREPENRLPRPTHYRIIESAATEATAFGRELKAHLIAIPKRVVAPFCRNGSRTEYNGAGDWVPGTGFVFFEDYISPYQEHTYRISAEQLQQHSDGDGTVRVIFRVNYGAVSICMARELTRNSMQCHSIDEMGTADFRLVAPCAGEGPCSAVYFFVTLDKTQLRCSETACRYPDQVLLIMRHSGLRCEPDDRSAAGRTGTGWRSGLGGMVWMLVGAIYVTSSIV